MRYEEIVLFILRRSLGRSASRQRTQEPDDRQESSETSSPGAPIDAGVSRRGPLRRLSDIKDEDIHPYGIHVEKYSRQTFRSESRPSVHGYLIKPERVSVITMQSKVDLRERNLPAPGLNSSRATARCPFLRNEIRRRMVI
ncbi:hypothetical protein EVAR_27260_1 [Eumeta japonica]|uniref:Uncharacterized protein n=1 Tax=Eumeta variegata TaxID=151549 RepID=A0A4C1VZR6_EUMVA|nr:hypothetical protein EVAR_27260_1 [Eumeta japonica]